MGGSVKKGTIKKRSRKKRYHSRFPAREKGRHYLLALESENGLLTQFCLVSKQVIFRSSLQAVRASLRFSRYSDFYSIMFFHSVAFCGVRFHRKLLTGRFSKRKIIVPPQIMLLKERKPSTLIGNSTITLESQHHIRIPPLFALYFFPDRQHTDFNFFHLALASHIVQLKYITSKAQWTIQLTFQPHSV